MCTQCYTHETNTRAKRSRVRIIVRTNTIIIIIVIALRRGLLRGEYESIWINVVLLVDVAKGVKKKKTREYSTASNPAKHVKNVLPFILISRRDDDQSHYYNVCVRVLLTTIVLTFTPSTCYRFYRLQNRWTVSPPRPPRLRARVL